MKSGYHDHFCKQCGYGFICHKVTHCQEPFETPCLDHREGLSAERAEEHYLETGKRPGE